MSEQILVRGVNPVVEPSDFPENLSKCQPPEKFVVDTAWHKAEDVARRFSESGTSFDVVIGCDSIIFFDGLILGKPRDLEDAFDTLKRLNGQKHTVYTGVSLINQQLEVQKFYDETIVEFGNIPEKVLKAYVDSGDPMGHAGSYAIQGKAGAFVKSITGSYHNVVGLPIYEIVKRLPSFIQQ
uniref:Uncharacterized protein n=1 Tax=Ditylenchus dipsaci TaxID=166011 RepID=A0A915DZV7_9BILA